MFSSNGRSSYEVRLVTGQSAGNLALQMTQEAVIGGSSIRACRSTLSPVSGSCSDLPLRGDTFPEEESDSENGPESAKTRQKERDLMNQLRPQFAEFSHIPLRKTQIIQAGRWADNRRPLLGAKVSEKRGLRGTLKAARALARLY